MKNLPLSFPCAVTVSLALSPFAAVAEAPVTLPEISVVGTPLHERPRYAPGNDTARMLDDVPGYSTAAGGGVSGLPVVNGFDDDRLKIRIDGMEITSACGNHMNAPLSYLDPSQVGSIRLMAGVIPVSMGGDSTGGTIDVQSPEPVFADSPGTIHTEGRLSLSGRSVNDSLSAGVSATMASESLSLSYQGTHARARSYKDGDGNKVLGSLYESNNQSLALAARGAGRQLVLRAGEQRIPYQGFPNQYMDMTENHGRFANLGYEHEFGWGTLHARLYWQDTDHKMGFFTAERPGTMPMHTEGRDRGYTLKAEVPLLRHGTLRIGHEYHSFRLDDYWPPVPASMMMGPQTYLNINGGKRDRLALYGEWEHEIAPRWTTLFGVRTEHVKTGTGAVQPYGTGMMQAADVAAAAAFNSRSRARSDNNIDLTALARFEPDASRSYEFGYARKTRSPNLYERYSWGRGTMAMTMTNWFGDGNGYVGDIDLRPEVAHTLSASASWQDEQDGWQLKLSPYFSHVENYIDADVIGSFNPYMVMSANGNLLRFANHDARLYGVNLSWNYLLQKNGAWGEISFKGKAGISRGKRADGGNLYRMMPFNALLTIEQSKGSWSNAIELATVSAKTAVDQRRREIPTGGHALVNLRTAYQLSGAVRLTAGVSNLFDRQYAHPLGGVYLSGLANAGAGPLQALPGEGRSVDLGISIAF